MASYNLSEGALEVIMQGGEYNDNEPTMQILGIRKVTSGDVDKQRFRILLSDGKHAVSFVMLAAQLIEKIGLVTIFSVVKIKRYITSVVNNDNGQNRRVLLIFDMELVASGEEVGDKLGSPTFLEIKPENQLPVANKQ